MKRNLSPQKLALTGLFASLSAIGAFIRIPMGYSSFTLQVLFVFLSGVFLGPFCGMLSQLVYVGLGLAGLPIFTGGGGLLYVFQPTFGFLLSYPAAAWTVGKIAEKSSQMSRVFLGCLAGSVLIYLIGMPYMAMILNGYLGKHLSLSSLLWAGMIPYLPFDALKILVTMVTAKALIPPLSRMELF